MGNKVVSGIALTQLDALDLISDLLREGFTGSDISLLTRGDEPSVLTSLLAPLERVGPIAIAGTEAFVVAGPIGDTLRDASSGIGMALAPGLLELGIPEKLALRCEAEVYWGSVLVAVHGQENSRANLAMLIFTVAAADHVVVVDERGARALGAPTAATAAALGA